ncbi:MAG TPA: hypothetical protein VGX28_06045 [Frankiaceae bacterium]|nr:hypothetical protein [Frankiaceae bacterium]
MEKMFWFALTSAMSLVIYGALTYISAKRVQWNIDAQTNALRRAGVAAKVVARRAHDLSVEHQAHVKPPLPPVGLLGQVASVVRSSKRAQPGLENPP